jgi:hypothetical protein
MFTICVHSKSSGNPVGSKKVFVSFGSTWLEEYTNSSGEAHFDTYPRTGEVIVEGTTRHSGHLSGKVVVYI